jgi:hypothetical protein
MNPIDEHREPAADMRTAARQLREYYVALVREGFTESEALRIIGMVLAGFRDNGEK